MPGEIQKDGMADELLESSISSNFTENSTSDVSMKDDEYHHSGPDVTDNREHSLRITRPDTGVTNTAAFAHARKEFNKNRRIIIKNVPPVTYEVNCQLLSIFLNLLCVCCV